jgi:TonB family protein
MIHGRTSAPATIAAASLWCTLTMNPTPTFAGAQTVAVDRQLDEARTLYQDGRFDAAVATLRGAIEQLQQLRDVQSRKVQLADAHYLGVKIPGTVGTLFGNNFGMSRLERSFEAKLEVQRQAVGPPKKSTATDRLAGMTQEQLRSQFGPPSLVQDSVWYYDTPKRTLRISFKDDVVAGAEPGDFDLSVLTRSVPRPGIATMKDPGLTPPSLIKEVKPNYTSEARRALIQGSVFVECVVGIDGVCSGMWIVRSLDPEFGLDEEAVKALQQWRFKPGTIDDKRVPVLVIIEMSFVLRK